MSSTQKNKINSLITVIGIIFLSIIIALISYDILFGTYSINSNNKISNVVISKEKQLTKINNENAELIEKIDSIKFGSMNLARDILSLDDNLQRALSAISEKEK